MPWGFVVLAPSDFCDAIAICLCVAWTVPVTTTWPKSWQSKICRGKLIAAQTTRITQGRWNLPASHTCSIDRERRRPARCNIQDTWTKITANIYLSEIHSSKPRFGNYAPKKKNIFGPTHPECKSSLHVKYAHTCITLAKIKCSRWQPWANWKCHHRRSTPTLVWVP